jgi:hypothetical protein
MNEITYHGSYNIFRDENNFFISVLLSDIREYYHSVKRKHSPLDIAELLIEKLDFYHDLYYHFYTTFVLEAILDFKFALTNYINYDANNPVLENLNLLLQQVAARYSKTGFGRSSVTYPSFKRTYVTFVRDGLQLISYFDLVVKGCKVTDGSINFMNRSYRVSYPKPERNKPACYVIPDRHGSYCYPADSVMQKIRTHGKDIIKFYGKVTGRNRAVFRYKGNRYYPLSET